MNLDHIHFIREVLIRDYAGKDIPTMQTSTGNTAALDPKFTETAFYETDAVRALYHQLGGGRPEGVKMGSTVILPHRSRWASLWRITPEQVQVVEYVGAPEETAAQRNQRQGIASARNRMMRD